jgi:hypothetical protein
MEWCLAQHVQGIPALAVRYDGLNTQREQVATAILANCGLPTTHVCDLLGVFGRDAQAGTALAREHPTEGNAVRLSAEEVGQITRVLQRQPVIRRADFVAPGTLQV